MSGYEVVEFDGVRFAEILWASARVPVTKFFSPPQSSFQFGLLAHEAGFVEAPHTHKAIARTVNDLQQMLVVQRGVLGVQFFSAQGRLLREVVLRAGDAINLVHGAHAIRVIEDMQCISVKQGPFLGADQDKVDLGAT
jgi:hypothetical protein